LDFPGTTLEKDTLSRPADGPASQDHRPAWALVVDAYWQIERDI
jgi:hypothetical protein